MNKVVAVYFVVLLHVLPSWANPLTIRNIFQRGRISSQSQNQARVKFTPPVGHVNDFAAVIDDVTKQQLEKTLKNLRTKSDIEFKLVTVKTTNGQDIFDFSRQIATDWNIGKSTPSKTVLLVVSIQEKTIFTQFTRAAQTQMPDGVLGEMRVRMQEPINSGNYNQGFVSGIGFFIEALAKKIGFSMKGIDETDPVVTSAIAGKYPLANGVGKTSSTPTAIVAKQAGGQNPTIVGNEVKTASTLAKPASIPTEPALPMPSEKVREPEETSKNETANVPLVSEEVGKLAANENIITVTGLVTHQGTRTLKGESVPLYVIISEVQPRDDAGRVTVMRSGTPMATFDLHDPTGLNFNVQSGDVINITLRPQEFYYIGGRINRPGQKVYQPGMTLLQAVLAAGGVSRANDNKIELMREGADGLLKTISFDLRDIKSGKVPDPHIQSGDSLEIVN